MKMFATVTAAAIALAGASFAQTTTQAAVLGGSTDPVYSLQVQGANGVIYNCKPQPVVVDDDAARVCVRADGAGLYQAGAGMRGGAAAAGVTLILIGLAAGSSSSTTTTTP